MECKGLDICTFWWGERLRRIDVVCLKSMVKAGCRVKLFTFGPVDGMPRSVERHDAARILSKDVFRRLDPHFPALRSKVTIQQYSDIFRIALMKHGEGFWLDTDVLLLKPFSPPADRPFLARENRSRLGVSALFFPPAHPVVGEFDAYLAGSARLPQWLGFRRRVLRPLLYRLAGKELSLAEAGITIFGNDGLTRLGHRYGYFRDAAPKETFYWLNGKDTLAFYDPSFDFRPLFGPGVHGFHVHMKEPSGEPPRPGSFYDWAVRHVADVD
jgi:hypothetical protein